MPRTPGYLTLTAVREMPPPEPTWLNQLQLNRYRSAHRQHIDCQIMGERGDTANRTEGNELRSLFERHGRPIFQYDQNAQNNKSEDYCPKQIRMTENPAAVAIRLITPSLPSDAWHTPKPTVQASGIDSLHNIERAHARSAQNVENRGGRRARRS